MNSSRQSKIIIYFLMALLLSGCLIKVSSSPAREQDFLLLYSNDVTGETEPCG